MPENIEHFSKGDHTVYWQGELTKSCLNCCGGLAWDKCTARRILRNSPGAFRRYEVDPIV